ncbi:hypothetical protein S7335_4390 [Synechococcus sp. PCC 7335]|uniref:DUF1997 domain-containing protein n=1 Tax=Synechococcus sp. (strain ATCC 29403 / PCC 7335) TaxID=91464 RepID=UPI00017ECEF1|nr:DUF1997 domain-containing protein [Synechococcus sp. PCC 7335]EDX86684.1 hypothetical protein S7335_4390 [Synechococcus sp. PCC 7335]
MVRFTACQAVTISVPEQPLPIETYLSEPQRLVTALVDKTQVEVLGPNLFRLKIRPLKFVGLTIQPVCDIEIWLEEQTVRLRSNQCHIEGYESFNQKFSMDMQGYLVSQSTSTGKKLRGQANLRVSVDLPSVATLMPRPILVRTGNGLLNSILITLKQRLMRQLITDYCNWATADVTSQSPGSPKHSFS